MVIAALYFVFRTIRQIAVVTTDDDSHGYHSDDDSVEECPEQLGACIEDPDCHWCLTQFDGDVCEDDGSTCSSLVDYFCCHIPESCSDNPLLVEYAGR